LTLPDGGPPIAKARVLIVDDSREIREGVRALLATEPSMLVVGEASNGDEALGIALVLRPDLIVLDHEMPGTRGLDLLPKLRVILPGVRVVMFTMSSGISSQALRRGADAVAAKDDPAGLLGALRRSAATRAESRVPEQPRRTLALGRGWWRRALLVSALALLYVVSFIPLVGWIGGPAIDLAILVVVASGATFGLWGGLAAALLVLPVNAVLIRLAGVSVPEAGSPTHVLIAIAIGAAFGRLRDVSARADAQSRSLAETGAALEASDQRLVGLVEDAPVLLVSIDLGGVIVDALGSGFGDHPKFSPERMRGQQAAVFYADNPGLLARLSRALSGEDFTERVESYGFVYDVHLRPRHDRAGAVDGATVVLVNVSGRVRAEQRLERAAFHDPLTGLPNRILLQDRLHQALRAAGRTRGGVAVLVLGLDSFRSVNNTYGHSVGDVLLHEIGERLRGTIRAVDTLARFSGDEFAIVLADCPPGGDVAVVAKVREALVAPFVVAGAAARCQRERRQRLPSRRWRRSADPHAQGRGRDVRGETVPRRPRALSGGARYAWRGPDDAHDRAARGARERRAGAALPAGGRGVGGPGGDGRGADPLGSSRARSDPAAGIHSLGRGDGPDATADRLGARAGRRPMPTIAGCRLAGTDRGQPVGAQPGR